MGRSEHRIGNALREIDRNKFILSTKVGRILEKNKPATKPVIVAQNTPIAPCGSPSVPSPIIVWIIKYEAIIINTADTNSPIFNALWGEP